MAIKCRIKRKQFLAEHYPGIYLMAAKQMIVQDREREIGGFMDRCKQLRDSVESYSLYVHGFLQPWINEQR